MRLLTPTFLIALSSVSLAAAQSQTLDKVEKRAAELTKTFTELAAKTGPNPSQEQLDKLDAVLQEIKALRKDVAAAKSGITVNSPGSKTKLYGYVQTQFQEQDTAGANDGFRVRRVRLRLDHTIDSRFDLKTQFDFVSGTNQNTAELKDAYVIGKLGPDSAKDLTVGYVGQMYFPLGNDIIKSQADYEFAERTVYNVNQFNGYRSRGAYVEQKLGKSLTASVGAFDSLAILDNEQKTRAQAAAGRLVTYGGVRFHQGSTDLGVTGITGERPDFDNGAGTKFPSTKRDYLYVSGGTKIGSNLSIRGEWMKGKDRVVGGALKTATDQSGFYGLASLKLTPKDDFNLRYQKWDRNTDVDGDFQEAYGVSFRHNFTDAVMLMLAYERFQENNAPGKPDKSPFGQLTARLQVKF